MTEQQTTTGQHTTWIADDAHGEPTLWRTGERPLQPKALMCRYQAPEAFDYIRDLMGQRYDLLRRAETGTVGDYSAGVGTETTPDASEAQRQVDTATILSADGRGVAEFDEIGVRWFREDAVEQIVTARLLAAAEAIEGGADAHNAEIAKIAGVAEVRQTGTAIGMRRAARIVRDLVGGGR